MSLDNIQLSPFLVRELYKDSLIVPDNHQPNNELPKKDEPGYLGNNERNILLLVHEENAVHLTDNDLNFLIGILTACKLSLSDTALINYHSNTNINYKKLLKKFKPDTIIIFGIEPANLGFPLQFPHYQVQKYNNQSYLSAPSLNDLAADKQKKQLLWAGLKKIFAI